MKKFAVGTESSRKAKKSTSFAPRLICDSELKRTRKKSMDAKSQGWNGTVCLLQRLIILLILFIVKIPCRSERRILNGWTYKNDPSIFNLNFEKLTYKWLKISSSINEFLAAYHRWEFYLGSEGTDYVTFVCSYTIIIYSSTYYYIFLNPPLIVINN